MQLSTRWLGFAVLSSLTRSAIHFFPSAGNVTAPYPVTCRLTVFGAGIEPRMLSLDGLRLSQPEGVWLNEVFPELKDGEGGLIGLEIALSSAQARVDLSGSLCLLEFFSNSQSCRFQPHRICDEQSGAAQAPIGLAIKDAFSHSSLVLVNSSDQSFTPRFELRVRQEQAGILLPIAAEGLGAKQVREIDLSNLGGRDSFAEISPIECSFGLLRMQQLRSLESLPANVAGFVLCRDVLTRRITSVSAL